MKGFVGIRLDEAKKAVYAERAAAAGMDLSSYLRSRLEEGDQILSEISRLRGLVEQMDRSPARSGDGASVDLTPILDRLDQMSAGEVSGSSTVNAVQLETLLLLRTIANQQSARMVNADLVRHGLTPWTPQPQ